MVLVGVSNSLFGGAVWPCRYESAVERVVGDVHSRVGRMLARAQRGQALRRMDGYRERILMSAVQRQHMRQGRLGYPAPHVDRLAQRYMHKQQQQRCVQCLLVRSWWLELTVCTHTSCGEGREATAGGLDGSMSQSWSQWLSPSGAEDGFGSSTWDGDDEPTQ